jgi:hypothetical protein
MLKDISPFKLQHNGNQVELLITPQYEPVMLDEQEVLSLSNVYDIDQTAAMVNNVNTPLTPPAPVGKLIFDEEHNWRYVGTSLLTETDQAEIAKYIQGFASAVPVPDEVEYDNQFSFYLELETKLEYCTIKILGDKYEVWLKGLHAADLKYTDDSTWEQIWGEKLPNHSIKEIGDRIDMKQM